MRLTIALIFQDQSGVRGESKHWKLIIVAVKLKTVIIYGCSKRVQIKKPFDSAAADFKINNFVFLCNRQLFIYGRYFYHWWVSYNVIKHNIRHQVYLLQPFFTERRHFATNCWIKPAHQTNCNQSIRISA